MKMKGTEILLKALEEENVDIIFGYPGGAVLRSPRPGGDGLYQEHVCD